MMKRRRHEHAPRDEGLPARQRRGVDEPGIRGCQQDRPPQSEAETHWLDQCEANADCGDGLCVCGVCTAACDADNVCDGEAQPACANVQQLAQVCGAPVPVCVRECAVDADCGAGDFECSVGVCIAADPPPPEPDVPEPDDCSTGCDRLADCAVPLCSGIDADSRDALADGCREQCAQAPALAALIASQDTCDGLIDTVRNADAGFEATCSGTQQMCAEICDDFSGCFENICARQTPDALAAECRMTCELLGPAEWGIGLQTCDGVERFMRDSWPNAAEACWPDGRPIPDCEAACADVEQCFNTECVGSPYGELGAACLQECAEVGAAEFDAQFVCAPGLPDSNVPGLSEACIEPEFVSGCSMVGPTLADGGNPFDNARRTAAEFDLLKPQLRAVYDKVLFAADPPTRDALNAATDWLLADLRACEFDCTAPEVDSLLSALARTTAILLDQPTHAAQQLNQCLSIVARRIGQVQYGYVASICGEDHGSARAIAQFAESIDATALDMLCVTRNAYDLCQARYLGANTLTEADRCPTCTVGFGETTCEVPARDTCGAAGECLCAATGAEGEACEFQAFGPRGAIAFGEACGQSDAVGPVVSAGGYDDGGLEPTASAGCDLMPAVLENRACGVPEGPPCLACGAGLAGTTCEPGNPGCAVYIDCEQRWVAPTAACQDMGGLCRDGWEAVTVCLDDLPCEPARDCGIDGVACQPIRP